MWSLRRPTHPLRIQGYYNAISRAFKFKLAMEKNVIGDGGCICAAAYFFPGRCLPQKEFYHSVHVCGKSFLGVRNLCSQASAKSNDNGDLENGLPEPEASAMAGDNVEGKDGKERVSEPELLGNDLYKASPKGLDLSDTNLDVNVEDSQKKRGPSDLFEVIIAAPGQSIHVALEKWIDEGNDLGRTEISLTMLNLRKRQMYGKALQLFKWLEAKERLKFTERDYASCVDLIVKVCGFQKAEKYVKKLPKSFRGEVIYRTLLSNCVDAVNMEKAEQVLITMRELGLPITIFSCNQLILLYKRADKKKIADVLSLMEKENVMPFLHTYNILIDSKGESNDFVGMEQLVKVMKAEGIKPDIHTHTILAKHYIFGGLEGKAEAVLKDMEEESLKGNRGARRALLPLYASLGNVDDMSRIWKACELNPNIDEYMAAIEAWGKLGKIEEAEEIFEKMLRKWEKLSSRHFFTLLNVYAGHKLVTKAKVLVKRMRDRGFWVGPLTWDALVRLCVEAGQVEKADLILQRAAQAKHMKPLFDSYMVIMDQYAKQGDVHNTEKLLFEMRQCGYIGRLKPYEVLLQAYINAKVPIYGIHERMKADNVSPHRLLAAKLAGADAFSLKTVSY